MDKQTSVEHLSEPSLKVSTMLDPWIDQGRQEGSVMITSKILLLEWTLACSFSSVEEWREKERIKKQEVDKEVVLEEKAGKEHNGFAVGEEEWEHLLLDLQTMNLGVEVKGNVSS